MKKLIFNISFLMLLAAASSQGQIGVSLWSRDLLIDQMAYLSAVKAFMEQDPGLVISDSIICIFPGYGSMSPNNIVSGLNKTLRQNGYTIYSNRSLADEINQRRSVHSGIDPRIRPTSAQGDIPRYCLVIRPSTSGPLLYLQDFLAINPWRWAGDINSQADELVAALLFELKNVQVPEIDLSQIEPERYDYLMSLAEEPFDKETHAALKQLAEDGWSMEIAYGELGEFYDISTLKMTPTELAGLGKLSCARLVSLTLTRPVNSPERVNGLVSKLDSQDLYGNRVCRDSNSQIHSLSEAITYYPPFVLLDTAAVAEVSFDLSFLGYSNHLRNIFVLQGVPRLTIDPSWPYALFGTSEALTYLNDRQVKEFLLGLADIETMFNFSIGEVVKKVYVTTDQAINAGFRQHDEHSVYVHGPTLGDNFIAKSFGVRCRIVGQHEALHALGYKLGLQSDAVWLGLYEKLKAKNETTVSLETDNSFYYQLDEQRFDPDTIIYGGHSRSSASEFLASYLCSLVRPGWEQIIMRKEPEFRLVYAQVTQVMRNIFRRQEKLRRTPMFDLLEQRLAWLRKYEQE